MGSDTFGGRVGGGNDDINASMGYGGSSTGANFHGPRFNVNSGEGLGGYLETMSGQAGVQSNGGTTEAGAQFNLMGGGMTYNTPNSSSRFGLSLGFGGGGRVHDGEQQGFGIDAGPVSMDYKSNTFGENMSRFGEFLGTGGRSQGMKWG